MFASKTPRDLNRDPKPWRWRHSDGTRVLIRLARLTTEGASE